jgi:hypothetical protein
MGFYFRRSFGSGPFRINLSSRGVGYSVGTRGFRVGVSPSRRRYTNISIPGTGIGYRKSSKAGCVIALAGGLAGGLVVAMSVAEVLT